MFNGALTRLQYNSIADLFFPQAVMLHVLLGVVVWLVFSGNRKPGRRLMSLAFASMSFSVFYAAVSKGQSLTGVCFLVLMFCAGYDVVQPMTAWGRGEERPSWIRKFAWVALALAWVYPHHVAWWKAIVGSPLGVLPSPTLLALLALLWLAFPQTNRLLHWAAAIAGLLFGLHGLLIVRDVSDAALVAVAGLALRELIQSVREAGGMLEEDLTPDEELRPAEKRSKKEQVWRL